MAKLKRVLPILVRVLVLLISAGVCVWSIRSLFMTCIFNKTAVPVDAEINAVSGDFIAVTWDYEGHTEYGVLRTDNTALQVGDLAAIWICPSEPDLYSVRSNMPIWADIICCVMCFCILLFCLAMIKSGFLSNTDIKINDEG